MPYRDKSGNNVNEIANRGSIEQNTATDAIVITPSDSELLTKIPRAIYIGGAGDLRVLTLGGSDITFSALPVGMILPIQVKKVFATNTTATLLVGLY